MKTDDLAGPYTIGASETEDSTNNAMAMLGAGYERPVIQFEKPSDQLVETEAGLEVVKTLGWIKFSADFRKNMLKILKGSKLSVFICISLHLNENGTSFPGIDKIAEETGYDRDTVMIAIKEMEAIPNLISVLRERGKSNKYRPYFVSRGAKEPVQKIRLVGKQPVQKTKTGFGQTSPENLDSKENKRVNTTTTTATPKNVFQLYEENIGPLTPLIANELGSLEDDYSRAWVSMAISEAVEAEVRKLSYIKGVLRGYKDRGSPSIPREVKKFPQSKKTSKANSFVEALNSVETE